MQFNQIQYNKGTCLSPSFTALKSVRYKGQFDPIVSIKDAKTVKSFIDSTPIKNLCEKYDVKATFNAYKDPFYMDTNYETLTMECKEIMPSLKKSFKEKLKSIFKISSYIDNRKLLKVEFCGGNDCLEHSPLSPLSEVLKGVTDTEIERQLVTSERKLVLEKLHSIELKNAKREVRDYL